MDRKRRQKSGKMWHNTSGFLATLSEGRLLFTGAKPCKSQAVSEMNYCRTERGSAVMLYYFNTINNFNYVWRLFSTIENWCNRSVLLYFKKTEMQLLIKQFVLSQSVGVKKEPLDEQDHFLRDIILPVALKIFILQITTMFSFLQYFEHPWCFKCRGVSLPCRFSSSQTKGQSASHHAK